MRSAGDISPLLQAFLLAYNAVLFTLPWVLGAVIRSLRESKRELADRAAELQAEREENARQAVFAERVRIARELHDVVAHHVSVMGVQAGAARRVMERQPDKAVAALDSIEASSRQAVVELHRLLGFLRRAGEADELAPQPGLAQLGDLVAQVAQGELTVELAIEGDPRPLPPPSRCPPTGSSKKPSPTPASTRAPDRHRAGPLRPDDARGRGARRRHRPGRAAAGNEGGHGLIGMRERAACMAATSVPGPDRDGGFAVTRPSR